MKLFYISYRVTQTQTVAESITNENDLSASYSRERVGAIFLYLNFPLSIVFDFNAGYLERDRTHYAMQTIPK